MSLDIKRAFRMTWSSQLWFQKILIGGLFCLVAGAASRYIPHFGGLIQMLIMSFVTGYNVLVMAQETRAEAGAVPQSLPEWANWGDLFKKGILLVGLTTIYSVLFYIVATMGLVFVGGASALEAMAHGADIPVALAVYGLFALAAGLFFFGVFVPLMSVHYAHEARFSAGFQMGKIMSKATAHPGNVFKALLVTLGVAVLTVLVSLTVIAAPFAVFTAEVIISNVWGQVYRCAGERA